MLETSSRSDVPTQVGLNATGSAATAVLAEDTSLTRLGAWIQVDPANSGTVSIVKSTDTSVTARPTLPASAWYFHPGVSALYMLGSASGQKVNVVAYYR